MTPDDVLEELAAIRTELDTLPPDAVRRIDLEARRQDLHAAARDHADASQNREALTRELDHLRHRRSKLDKERINVPAWQAAMASGSKLAINDPATYASKLNEALDEVSAPERAEIEERIVQLERILGV